MLRTTLLILSAIALMTLSACNHEIGSENWCQMMKDKPKGDWTANDTADFAKHCIFPSDDK